jgi:hypothetical protein
MAISYTNSWWNTDRSKGTHTEKCIWWLTVSINVIMNSVECTIMNEWNEWMKWIEGTCKTYIPHSSWCPWYPYLLLVEVWLWNHCAMLTIHQYCNYVYVIVFMVFISIVKSWCTVWARKTINIVGTIKIRKINENTFLDGWM